MFKIFLATITCASMAFAQDLETINLSQNDSKIASEMRISAMQLLASMTSSQKDKATYSFNSKQRLEWRYLPSPSKIGSVLLPEHQVFRTLS